MKIYIAGINHFDPTGRNKLKDLLQHLSTENNGRPLFIATEWDSNLFAQVRGQRREFRRLIQKEWPHANSDLLDALELSLAYEADAHVDAYPDTEILWLDQGREASVEAYSKNRFKIYKDFLKGESLPMDCASALSKLGNAAQQRAEELMQGNERDVKFVSLVEQKIANHSNGWIVVIVGSSHALSHEGSMRTLFEEGGHFCEVTIL